MRSSGKYVKQPSGYKAFIPGPLPPEPPLVIDGEMNLLLADANLSLGRLSGLSGSIPDPDLFIYLYVRKEALLSSQIEGTQCSLEDVLNPNDDSNMSSPEDIEEVSNYVKAMNSALAQLEELPFSYRLMNKTHAILMKGVRGFQKTPGEMRRSQNWIGRPGATLMSAEFIPPPPEELGQLISNLEKFIHRQDHIPALIKLAMIHAQFETIHPYLDGNGRLGRLLITYLLCSWEILDKPLLYISYSLKAHRTEYYARLMDVRLIGDWESWVKFFLRAVKESSEIAAQAAMEIFQLHKKHRELLLGGNPSKSTILVYEYFCRVPILSNGLLVKKLKSTKPTIQNALDSLEGLGLIFEASGKKRGRRYVYKEYLDILTRDTVTRIG